MGRPGLVQPKLIRRLHDFTGYRCSLVHDQEREIGRKMLQAQITGQRDPRRLLSRPLAACAAGGGLNSRTSNLHGFCLAGPALPVVVALPVLR